MLIDLCASGIFDQRARMLLTGSSCPRALSQMWRRSLASDCWLVVTTTLCLLGVRMTDEISSHLIVFLVYACRDDVLHDSSPCGVSQTLTESSELHDFCERVILGPFEEELKARETLPTACTPSQS